MGSKNKKRRVSKYIMESPREVGRLEGKTAPQLARRQLTWAGLRAGMSALEIGCGSGAVTRVMGRIAGPGLAMGVDQSPERIKSARALARKERVKVGFQIGDAYRLPIPDANIDFAWSRFLFQYLKEPNRALQEMIRVTRAGGIVAVADLDGQLEQFYPLDRSLQRDAAEALRLLSTTGLDTRIGRKLYTMFYEAGLQRIRVTAAPYQLYAGKLDAAALSNWTIKLENTARVLAGITGDTARWRAFSDRFMKRIVQKDLFYYCTVIQVSGRIPP
jgi:ubiquinone/menaquinone biosynthesis C-methylase UbiE